MENIERDALKAKLDVTHAQETLSILKDEANKEHVKHNEEILRLAQELIAANEKIEHLYKDVHQQNKILAKPLKELLTEYELLKKSNEEQQAIIVMWMLSQRAMKCVAFDLANSLGFSTTEVSDRAIDCANKILKDKNSFNGTILDPNMELFEKHKDFLLEKFKQK